jgi:hypothetical protein
MPAGVTQDKRDAGREFRRSGAASSQNHHRQKSCAPITNEKNATLSSLCQVPRLKHQVPRLVIVTARNQLVHVSLVHIPKQPKWLVADPIEAQGLKLGLRDVTDLFGLGV